jgi:ligand-binding SRPBCC domain-containing protein
MRTLQYTQKIPIALTDCWEFFSCPANLNVLTPEYLRFTCTNDPQKMYPGQIITYTIRPFLHLPITWVTEITHMVPQEYFIDEQRFGPYKFWHHEHRFKALGDGVEMVDIIHYKLPFGVLGSLLSAKVQKDIDAIFAYRKTKIESLFGTA